MAYTKISKTLDHLFRSFNTFTRLLNGI